MGDSAYYEPERKAIYHYKGRWFLVNTAKEVVGVYQLGVDAWAVGLKEVQMKTGAWQDAEDGRLSGNAVAQGSVDSCIALHLEAPGDGTVTGWYWIAAADSFEEVTRINRIVRQKSPSVLLHRTHHYWYRWLHKDVATEQQTGQKQHLFRRSLLLLCEHINNNGAVIASTDYAMAQEYRDTYCYVWPRDAAITISALLEAKYTTISNQFFHFCHSIITKEGYLLHKYNPDGSLASSWIGWYYENKKELPVQEDETALILWTLWRYFDQFTQ